MKVGGKGSKKKKGKKQSTNAAPSTKPISSRHHVHLGQCTSDYARALVNPHTGPLACIPNFPVQLTKKFRTWVKGTLSTGTLGFGYIAVDPSRMIANDALAVKFTGALYAQAVIDLNGGSAGVGAASSNAEYTSAQIGPAAAQLAGRVTSCEVKFRYIGTTFNQGGEIAAYQDQDHNSLAGRTFATVNGEETSKKFPVTRTWTSVLYRPVDSGDLDFFTAFPLATAPPIATDPSYYMGAVFQAPSAGTPAVFEWEAWATFEAYGQNIRAMSPSHADAVGFQAVHTVSQLTALLHPTQVTEENREKQILLATAKHVATQSTISSSGISWAPNAFENAKRKDAKLAGIEGASGTAAGLAAGLVALNVLDFLF